MLGEVLGHGSGYEHENEHEHEHDRDGSWAISSNGFESENEGRRAAGWLRAWRDGRIKLHVTAGALRFRRAHAALFADGDYIPLEVTGSRAECAFAFARRREREWCVVVAPRFTTRLARPGALPAPADWFDTALRLPVGAPPAWRDVLGGAGGTAEDGALRLERLLAALPFALLSPA